MYADAYEHGSKGKILFSPEYKLLQGTAVQDPVIDLLTGGSFFVNIFISLGLPGNTGLETQVTAVLYVDSAVISVRRAGTAY